MSVGEVFEREDGKIEIKVPVTYEMYAYVPMEFDSKEDMYEKLKDPMFVDQMPLGEESDYVDGSYEINFDMIEALDESVGDEISHK